MDNIATVLSELSELSTSTLPGLPITWDRPRNLRLSRNRAKTVVAELVSKGVPPGRSNVEGYGEEYPIADNDTPEGRAQNRRAAMQVTQK